MKSSEKSAAVFLQDILDAIDRVEAYATAGEQQFFSSGLLQDAIIRQLSIVGEASARLPKHLRSQQPQIPWIDVIAMRNIIIHDYSEIDLPTVWGTVHDLPALRAAVLSLQAHVSNRKAA